MAMLTLIVYDSTYGNTKRVAQAIAGGVAASGTVRVLSAVEATAQLPERPDLLLVGGPTQRHRLSPALRAFLDALPRGSLSGVPAATFDTRYRMSALLTGSAANDAKGRLRKAGCRLVALPESFFMERDLPPKGEKRRHELEGLEAGEVERAQKWGLAVWTAAQQQPKQASAG
jgi:flavodoxin